MLKTTFSDSGGSGQYVGLCTLGRKNVVVGFSATGWFYVRWFICWLHGYITRYMLRILLELNSVKASTVSGNKLAFDVHGQLAPFQSAQPIMDVES